MNRHIIFLVVLFLPSALLAFEPHFSVQEDPFHVFTISPDIEVKREYYGSLVGQPHLYEVTLDAPALLSVQVLTPASNPTKNLGGIAVSVLPSGGVKEVGRLQASTASWEPTQLAYLNDDFLAGPTLEAELSAGTYRVEVNTPENRGDYVLIVGTDTPSSGYFELVGEVWSVKQFLGRSVFSMVTESVIYLPVGIVLMLVLIFITWRIRKPRS